MGTRAKKTSRVRKQEKMERERVEAEREREADEGAERLQAFYVRLALRNLLVIDQCIERVSDLANTSLLDFQAAMWRERKRLIEEKPAYAEAAVILGELVEAGVLSKSGDLFVGRCEEAT